MKGLDLGTFKGVYVPSILTVLGVILYMRMGWVVGHTGLWGSILIITLASIITFITGLSISSTATNMEIKAGGIYYMVSRSFGIEAGTAIGFPLYLAQTLGISFYIAGFSESIVQLLPWMPAIPLSLFSLIAISALAYYSPELAIKTQVFIFIIIMISILAFVFGSPVSSEGLSFEAVPPSESFWKVFAVFFPAVTGIGAGVSMSGDLKKPHKSLPIGTIAAILTGYVVYITFAVFLYQYASESQLKTDSRVIFAIALFPPAIYLGVWFATLSSALGSILGAPRTLQAMAQDKILPSALGKGFGKTNDPRVATVMTFLIAGGGILMGGLDVIAPILSMFFLTSYGALNLIAGLEGLLANPSWRPTFKAPWALSLLGAFACFGVMFMINPGASFVALFFCVGVYIIMKRRSVSSNWSDIRRGLMSYLARSSVYGLQEYEEDARSWRPSLLVTVDDTLKNKGFLVKFADSLCRGKGLLCLASIVNKNQPIDNDLQLYERSLQKQIQTNRITALAKVKFCDNFFLGASSLIADYGLGPLKPNTVILECPKKENSNHDEFFLFLKNVHSLGKNILLIREGELNDLGTKHHRRLIKKIDLYWDTQSESSSLMLALAYMLQSSPEYMRSILTLKYCLDKDEVLFKAQAHLKKFLKNSRIKAEIDIFTDSTKDSQSPCDLIFQSLKAPEGSAETYMNYFFTSLEKNDPNTLLVFTIMGEKKIDFKDIFL